MSTNGYFGVGSQHTDNEKTIHMTTLFKVTRSRKLKDRFTFYVNGIIRFITTTKFLLIRIIIQQ